MSGEGDDALYHSPGGALLFPDLTDNGDELDFTKDFFSDELHQSTELNGPSYESLGGDDLIAELEGQDVFSRLPPPQLEDGTPTFGDVAMSKGNVPPLSFTSPAGQPPKPFGGPAYVGFQKPSITLSNAGAGGGTTTHFVGQEMYMPRNGISSLASPTSPAMKSGGLLSPGATSEKLNSLSLDHHHHSQMGGYPPYRQPSAYDVKGNVPRPLPKGGGGTGPYSPNGPGMAMQTSGGGDPQQRFPPFPLSPTMVVKPQANSNGLPDLASTIIAASDAMHSSSPTRPHSSDGASPRSLSNTSSAETADSLVDGMVVGEGGALKMQQSGNKPLFLASPGLAHRLDAPSVFVDGGGDALLPLPHSHSHSHRSSAMQRSYSSHALGQLRSLSPMAQSAGGGADQMGGGGGGTFSRIGSSEALPSRLSNESGSALMQPQVSSDLQSIHMRPLMQSMRRVHSTGDIQTLNGVAGGGTSPSALDRSNYEDGSFKIGRYTVEERKIRIHRYQQKRTQRNFNKKIKYACRKTLADSRPRVRGRFAKNDEVGEPLVKHESKDDDEEEMYEEEEFFVDEDSSGDLSDVLGMGGVKLEHPVGRGVKMEHHHHTGKQLLQT